MYAREGGWWDAYKIGLCPPPMRVSGGWLIMYHGVSQTASKQSYRLGLALLDLEDPRIVLHRSEKWVFGPTSRMNIVETSMLWFFLADGQLWTMNYVFTR